MEEEVLLLVDVEEVIFAMAEWFVFESAYSDVIGQTLLSYFGLASIGADYLLIVVKTKFEWFMHIYLLYFKRIVGWLNMLTWI